MEAYADILKGGFDKASEAGVRIIGGHTIDDSPPKYGLAVVGYIHPEKSLQIPEQTMRCSDLNKANWNGHSDGRSTGWDCC